MSDSVDKKVRDFVLRELPLVTTLFLKKIYPDDDAALQDLYESDDVAEMARHYFRHFNVLPAGFSIDNYFPWKTPSNKTNRQDKYPLTIRMFIESARAGCWLYQ
ncbi:DUF1493 family protein [Citrobacter amalonaticus]|uniref:DUF1493 family protein n=1 Tax=Citrobacter amalonaticus TaxID=35703 RepID=UPI00300C9FE8